MIWFFRDVEVGNIATIDLLAVCADAGVRELAWTFLKISATASAARVLART